MKQIVCLILSFALLLPLVSSVAASETEDTSVTEAVTEPVTEPVTEQITEPATEPVTEPITEPVTEPITEPVTEPVTEPPKKDRTQLELDSTSVFEGMDRAYQDGYIPRIQDGIALIVLPLTFQGTIRNCEVKAALELGAGGGSPFVAANYEKIFYLETVYPQGSEEGMERFLVRFPLTLLEERINGVYPVTVKVTAADETGEKVEFQYTVFVTITDGKSDKPTPPPPIYVEKPTAEPVVYISESKMEPAHANAGEEFQIILTIQNSLTTKWVKNILMTVETGNLQINLLESGAVIPLEDMEPGAQQRIPLHFSTDPGIGPGKHILKFHFRYDSNKTLGLSSEGMCIVDIRQPASLSFDGAQLPAKVFAGDTLPVVVNLMNTGKDKLYNCRVEYDVPGLSSGGISFAGELDPGSQKQMPANLRVGPDPMESAEGRILILFEDSYGNTYRMEQTLSTVIFPKPEPEEVPREEEKTTSYWWLYILLGLAVGAAAGIGVPWLIRDRKQRKEDDLRL